MDLNKAKMLQRKAAQAADFAMLCVDLLDPKMPYQEYAERFDDAREYQRQAQFLSACARHEMEVV